MAVQWHQHPRRHEFHADFGHVTGNDAGEYSVIVTNLNGSATSQVAVLTVIGQPPLITSAVDRRRQTGNGLQLHHHRPA